MATILICNLILLGIVVKILNEQSEVSKQQREHTKDKFVLIETNEIGCKHYTFNYDHIWKCPKGVDISEIERRVCGVGKFSNVCYYVYDPVLNESK